MDKVILILAGPNGEGKSTFAKSFLPLFPQRQRFINADLIAVVCRTGEVSELTF